jgi:hypothetical protein
MMEKVRSIAMISSLRSALKLRAYIGAAGTRQATRCPRDGYFRPIAGAQNYDDFIQMNPF